MAAPPKPEIEYPESDGKPMVDNSKQFDLIGLLYWNLKGLFGDRQDVLVSGNQFWYPVQGHPEIVQTPHFYVVFGRPKGDRGSWKQWEEAGVPMTVVFVLVSDLNTPEETAAKVRFYERYGAEECYVIDPHTNDLEAHVRAGAVLVQRQPEDLFISPRLGIQFDRTDKARDMVIRFPDGQPFLTFVQYYHRVRDAEKRAAEAARRRAFAAQQADDATRHRELSEARLRRVQEIVRKGLGGLASPEELAELAKLADERLGP